MTDKLSELNNDAARIYLRQCIADSEGFQQLSLAEKQELEVRGYAVKIGEGVRTEWRMTDAGHKLLGEADRMREGVDEPAVQLVMSREQAGQVRQALSFAATTNNDYADLMQVAKDIDALLRRED